MARGQPSKEPDVKIFRSKLSENCRDLIKESSDLSVKEIEGSGKQYNEGVSMFIFGKKQPSGQEIVFAYLKREMAKHSVSLTSSELKLLSEEIVSFVNEPHMPQFKTIVKHGPAVVIPTLVAQAIHWTGANSREAVIDLICAMEQPILTDLVDFMTKTAIHENFRYIPYAYNTAFWALAERASTGGEDVNAALDFLESLWTSHVLSKPGIFTSEDIQNVINKLNSYQHTNFKFAWGDYVRVKEAAASHKGIPDLASKIGQITKRSPSDYKRIDDQNDFNIYQVEFLDGSLSRTFREYELEFAD